MACYMWQCSICGKAVTTMNYWRHKKRKKSKKKDKRGGYE